MFNNMGSMEYRGLHYLCMKKVSQTLFGLTDFIYCSPISLEGFEAPAEYQASYLLEVA